MTKPVTWQQVRVKLSDLKPWPRNPRQIKQAQAERLLESFDEFDQVQTVAIGPDGEVYDGHQRLQVLRQEYGDDYELDARQASRPLSEKERERLTVLLHKGAAGDWDFDVLANEFELDDLMEWGFQGYELGVPDGIEPDPEAEWVGMPEYENEDKTAFRSIHIHFANQEAVDSFSELIEQPISSKTRSLWYPRIEIERYADKRYEDESS